MVNYVLAAVSPAAISQQLWRPWWEFGGASHAAANSVIESAESDEMYQTPQSAGVWICSHCWEKQFDLSYTVQLKACLRVSNCEPTCLELRSRMIIFLCLMLNLQFDSHIQATFIVLVFVI